MKQTIVKLVDDLDGKTADETVEFSYEGVEYTIDLSAGNAKKMRDALGPFADGGRRVPKQQRRPGPLATPEGRAQVRSWARKNGWPELGGRGRIPDVVAESYLAARRGYLNS